MKKKHFVLLVMLAMALVALPVIASEPLGPPGDPAVMLSVGSVSPQFVLVLKGPMAFDLDSFAIPTNNDLVLSSAVTQDILYLVGSSSAASAVENSSIYYDAPMLAGLMRGDIGINFMPSAEEYCVGFDPMDRFQALARDQCS